jgi:AraC-like DNA-binding protein
MILKEFPASPATRGVVRVYRIVQFNLDRVQAAAIKPYTPRPEHCLQFFIRDREVAQYPDGARHEATCVLTGLHDFTIHRIIPKDFLFLQVAFEPTALHRLTGMPLTRLQNQYLDATAILGTEVLRITEQLSEAASYQAMVGIVDAYIARLFAHARAERGFDLALRQLRDTPRASIDSIARQGSLSLRQFERRCREQTGMSPKGYARMARFDRAFHTKLSHPELDWLAIAVHYGYADYQHMVRDFKAFTGQSPPRALAMQMSAPEQLLGVAQEFHITDQWAPIREAAC